MSDSASSDSVFELPDGGRSPEVQPAAEKVDSGEPLLEPTASQADPERTVISARGSAGTRRRAAFQPAEVGDALIGEQLAHFRLEEFVGGGGMGAVFRGLDTTLGRIVAVKVVPSRNTDEDTLLRFQNEAQSAARLDHPNIARVYYVGEDKGWNFIVFEFIEGVNVRDLVEQHGPLSVDETIRYSIQITEALAHASTRNVVHRDIKPSNILVMQDGRAKLVDMGLARLHHLETQSKDITATGVTLGTFDYISPEQAKDPRSADVRSDLYSLGCTLYFMLTGLPPFPDGTVLQKLLSHSSEAPQDVRELQPAVNDEMAAVVVKLMAKQPGHRYQTPTELLADLGAIAGLLGLDDLARRSYSAASTISRPRSPARLHLPWIVACGLLLIAAIVLQIQWGPSAAQLQTIPRPQLTAPRPVEESRAIESGSESTEAGVSQATVSPVELVDSAPTSSADGAASELLPRSASEDGSLLEPGGREGQYPLDSNILVVGSPYDNPEVPEDMTAPTLQAALQKASELPGIETIELRVPRIEVQPLTFDLRRDLSVRAGWRYEPEVIFRPTSDALVPARRMAKLLGDHHIHFEGIHWRMDVLDASATPHSMFHLNQLDQVSFTDCTLTIRNESRVTAAFFSIQAGRPIERAVGDDFQPTPAPSIELKNTIARGQATLVHAVEGLPFWLNWEQGLFVSTERMVESGGLLQQTRGEMLRIDLNRVTAIMDQGLCRVSLNDNFPYVPTIDIDCWNCVLQHHAGQPLVEHLAVPDINEAIARFRFAGQQNLYESTQTRWLVRDLDDLEHRFTWTQQDGQWYDERQAERGVGWMDPLAEKPEIWRQNKRDYLLVPTQGRRVGFDEAFLPDPPPSLMQ